MTPRPAVLLWACAMCGAVMRAQPTAGEDTPRRDTALADDAAGWSASPMQAADDAAGWSASPTRAADDAAGWAASPTQAADDAASPTRAADDAAGWGPTPAADSGERLGAAAVGTSPAPAAAPQALHIELKLRERAGVWLERRTPSPLAQLRSSLQLRAGYSHDFVWEDSPASLRAGVGMRGEYDAVYRFSRSDYDRETLAAYELRLIGLETFISLRVGVFELSTGRLISTLGQGELQSAVDVLNPRDLRQPGATAIENMRLPVWTTRISLADETFRLEGFIVHEAYFGMLPPLLGTFSPVRKLLLERGAGADELAERNWQITHVPAGLDPRATQFVGRYGYTGDGVDIDLHVGSVLDQLGVAALPSPALFERQTVPIQLFHPRYTLLALTGANTLGDFLLRWELAAHLKKSMSVRRLDYQVPVIETQRYSQLSGLVGFTYFGLTDINLGVELMQSLVPNSPAREPATNSELLWPVEAPTLSLRYQHMLFDQRVTLSLLSLITGIAPFNGALVNVGLSYLPRDGLTLLLEYVHYASSSHFGYFYGFEKNDRIDLSLTWTQAVL